MNEVVIQKKINKKSIYHTIYQIINYEYVCEVRCRFILNVVLRFYILR